MPRRRSFVVSTLVVLALSMAVCVGAEPLPVERESRGPVAAGGDDPTDDPWLAEEGPAVSLSPEIARERVITAWREAPPRPHARSTALLRERLELGLGDLLAPASSIAAEHSEVDPTLYTEMARSLAPGLPSIQMAHAIALWRGGDVGTSILFLGRAFAATLVSLPAQLWLLENLAQLLLIVVLSASIAFVLLAAIQAFPHAAHDFGDLWSGRMPAFARFAALACVVLVPLHLGEGVLGVVLVLFTIAFVYGGGRQRNALVISAVLLVIGLHPLAQVARVTTGLLDRDPVLRSTLSVLGGTENEADVERLESAFEDDLMAAHALAYRARRYGLEEQSRQRLQSILERNPTDAVALANLGNIQKRRGDIAAAIALYERAAEQIDSPTLLFDLSQAYATTFRMEEYESALVRAQSLDGAEVAALSSLDDAELVADLGFPFALARERLRPLVLSARYDSRAIDAIAPGRLGDSWMRTGGAFALAVLFSLLFASRWDHSSQCARCGHRICTRCEETVWSEDICEDCHHLFQNPAATDPSLRRARLQALSMRESRFERAWLVLSLLIPGVAGFAARRPDLAIFGLLLFSWAAAWVVWPAGIQVDPMLMGDVAALTFAVPGVLAILAYAGVVVVSLVMRKSL